MLYSKRQTLQQVHTSRCFAWCRPSSPFLSLYDTLPQAVTYVCTETAVLRHVLKRTGVSFHAGQCPGFLGAVWCCGCWHGQHIVIPTPNRGFRLVRPWPEAQSVMSCLSVSGMAVAATCAVYYNCAARSSYQLYWLATMTQASVELARAGVALCRDCSPFAGA